MHTGFAPAAYHEPNQLDQSKPNSNRTNHIPTNRVKGPCHSWLWARLSWQFTLCRGCTTYPQVGDSITRRWLRVSILPNVHYLRCTARRSPHSLSQRFPAHKTSPLRFHRCGLHHPTEAPSCVKARITPSITQGWDYTILSFYLKHTQN
jgi:hypothetical protein